MEALDSMPNTANKHKTKKVPGKLGEGSHMKGQDDEAVNPCHTRNYPRTKETLHLVRIFVFVAQGIKELLALCH